MDETLNSVIQSEGSWLRVFKQRVLKKLFDAKRTDVKEDWRKFHREELHDLYVSPNIIKGIQSKRVRLVRFCESNHEHSYSIKFRGVLEDCETINVSRRTFPLGPG